jgi:xanthine dehydrogenase accessory factor
MGSDPLAAIGDGREILQLEAYAEFVRLCEKGQPAALVTVLQTGGSVPRGMGAAMTVRADGSTVGTIGGGSLEVLAGKEALASLRDGRPRRLHYDFTGGQDGNLPEKCGGIYDLFVQPSIGFPALYLFGAGHIGTALAPMAASAGFQVTVLDDRDGFPDPAAFPAGVDLVHGPFDERIESLRFDAGLTYVVIVSYSHAKDEQILEACLHREWKYMGMIGSRRKVESAFRKLGNDPASQERLALVRAPIGLDLGGRSTGEIAVSILAELLAVRNDRGQVIPMSEKNKRGG